MGFDLLPSTPHRYTLQRHRDQPNPAVFLLRSLPSRFMLAMSRLGQSEQDKALGAIVEAGLVGVEGLTRDGAPVVFEPAERRYLHGVEVSGGAKADLVDALPVWVLSELCEELMRINTIDVDSAKN